MTVEANYVELEMDELNKHECMATMIALLQHMQTAEVIPPVKAVSLYTDQSYIHVRMETCQIPAISKYKFL